MAKRRNGDRTSRGYYDDYGVISISKRALAIAFGVVVLLLGVAATVFCWGARDSAGHWAANPTITEWFNYWGKGAPEDEGNGDDEEYIETKTVIEQESGLFILTTRNAVAAPMALAAQEQSDGTSATITAQLSPANADFSAVNWTSSDNAVQLTKDEENPLRVQVTLASELNHTATITCEVVSVTTLTATCSVNFLHIPATIDINPLGGLSFGTEHSIIVSGDDGNFGTTGDYEIKVTGAEVSLTGETVTAITSRLGVNAGWDMGGGTFSNGKFILPTTPYAAFYGGDDNISEEDFRKAFFAVCNGKDDCAELNVQAALIFDGKTYKSYEKTISVGFVSSSYGVAANGVQIGDGVVITD